MKNVPVDVRHILVAESAANDGLAYPFLSIAIYLTTETSEGTAFAKWVVISWLCTSRIFMNLFLSNLSGFLDQVILGTILGVIIGMEFALDLVRRSGIDRYRRSLVRPSNEIRAREATP
jgi:sodium/hydrogen antiporter